MTWKHVWTRDTRKDLRILHPVDAQRIHRTLIRFSETGHADILVLINLTPETWRIRAGNHRIFVRFVDDLREMHIIGIRHRRSAY